MNEEDFALCRGCGQPTRQRVVRLEKPEGTDTGYTVIPVFHSECVPDAVKSGASWLRRKKRE